MPHLISLKTNQFKVKAQAAFLHGGCDAALQALTFKTINYPMQLLSIIVGFFGVFCAEFCFSTISFDYDGSGGNLSA